MAIQSILGQSKTLSVPVENPLLKVGELKKSSGYD
jgi:hypothetical protein